MKRNNNKKETKNFNRLFEKTTIGIIIACIMMILGVVFFFLPFKALSVFVWLSTVGFFLHGVYHIITFIKSKPKSIWPLLFFGLNILMATLFTIHALPPFGRPSMYSTVTILLCLYCFFDSIMQFASAFILKKAGREVGWIITTGVFNAMLALLILVKILYSFFSIEWTFALYFAIFGILLLVQSIPQPEMEKIPAKR